MIITVTCPSCRHPREHLQTPDSHQINLWRRECVTCGTAHTWPIDETLRRDGPAMLLEQGR